MEEGFVPLRINKDKQEAMFKDYLVTWTPTIALLDREGKEHYRFTGFLSPQELCARIILNGAKTEFDLDDHDRALAMANRVIDEYAGTFAVPEAVFYRCVVQYVSSDEAKFLREGLERLRKEFPDSEWTMRAKPYEQIDL
mgnify:CR=1 FL=1